MLSSINLYYIYYYILRFIFLYRSIIINNSYDIFYIKKLILFFSIKSVDSLNNVNFYNYYYLIKFFFGLRSFFTAYKSIFHLGVTTYNINIQSVLRRKDIYINLYFFINDIFKYIKKEYSFYHNISNNRGSSLFIIKDMSIFPNKKTNIGLFHLVDFLYLKIFYVGCDIKHLIFFKTFITKF